MLKMSKFLHSITKLWLLGVVIVAAIVGATSGNSGEGITTAPTNTTKSTTPTAKTVEATASLVNMTDNTVESSSATQNVSIYDHNHKILLVVLSDLNVRKVNGENQVVGKTSAETKLVGSKLSNETVVLDVQTLKDLIEKLQFLTAKDGGSNTEYNEQTPNANVPHYLQRTFPLIIQKADRKPIAYIESIACEDETKDKKLFVDSADAIESGENVRKKLNIPYPKLWPTSRVKTQRLRSRPQPVSYVVVPKFAYPFNYYHNYHNGMDYPQ